MEHVRGQGSPLIKAAIKQGIEYEFIVVKEFDNYSSAKAAEKSKKGRGGASRWCPYCKDQRRKV